MTLLDGKNLAEKIKANIGVEVRRLVASGNRAPHLAAILVGHDGASETYVASKIRSCAKIGFDSSLIRLNDDVSENELLDQIKKINDHDGIDGLIVQLPLPPHISPDKIAEAVSPAKDVDGFHPVNTGRMAQGRPCFVPATPKGILLLLEEYQIETGGMRCVVIGRSQIVGMPVSLLLSKNANPGNCTVTVCHSKTRDMESVCREADLLVAAMGRPGFVKRHMVKPGAVVIDVGITRVADAASPKGYRLSGDVDFENVAPLCSHITPVPGGVGAMTIAGLLLNTLSAAKKEISF